MSRKEIRTLETAAAEDAGFDADRIRLIDQRLASWVREGRTPAISALLARRGKVVLQKAYGVRTPAGETLAEDDVFPVMSVTKPFTAAAAMVLVEEGLLSLNRRLRDYVPEVEGKWTDEILIHHLMTHSAGYKEFDLFTHVAEHPVESLPPCPEGQHPFNHRWLEERWQAPLSFQPGTENSYGIHCMALLGEVIRRITAKPLEQVFREKLLEPLGMQDSDLVTNDRIRDRLVVRGERLPFGNDESFININTSFDIPSAGGGLLTTTRDLAVFAQTFLNGGIYNDQRILSERSTDEMMRNQLPGIPAMGWGDRMVPEASWGLGWMIQGEEKWPYWTGYLQPLGTIYHQGIGASFMWFDRQTEVIGVYLTVATEADMESGEHNWDLDLFQNMASAAVT
jgi:CubicO group peptidase (beta-lactamase class C family)